MALISVAGCRYTGIAFDALSSLSEVGIGLYLALAVVQAVGGVQLYALRRRATVIRTTANKARLVSVRRKLAQADSELLQLELDLEVKSRALLAVVVCLLLVAILGHLSAVIWGENLACGHWVWAYFLFYMVAPPAIFLLSTVYTYFAGRRTKNELDSLSRDVYNKLAARMR